MESAENTEPAQPTRNVINAAKVRASMQVTVDIGDGDCVIARRLDMTAMILEGLLPTPLLNIAQKMQEQGGHVSNMDRLLTIDDDEKLQLLKLLRHHAAAVVLQPIVVETDDGNHDHLPVEMLTLPQLMAIWSATMIVPPISTYAAARFRVPPRPHDDPAVPDGTDVRPAAEPLAVVERDVVTG